MSLLQAAAQQLSAQTIDGQAAGPLSTVNMPTARQEAWRYFPLRQVLARRYSSSSDTARQPLADIGAVFVVDALALHATTLPQVLRLSEVRESTDASATVGFDALTQQLSASRKVLDVLADPGLPLRLRRFDAAAVDALHAQHWTIRIADGVGVVVLDELSGAADSWNGDLLHIELGSGAQLTWIRLVDDAATAVRHSSTRLQLAAGAIVQWFGVEAGTGVSRHELRIALCGEQASATVRGGGLLSGKSYSETRLELDHQHAGGDSSTLWKLVGTQQSRGVFNGRIAIAKGADRSDAQLRTASLLLSDQAEIDVKPELEIYADEVSASHGATVGQLDERALFYLRSRGVALVDARRMLTEAFLRELYDGLPEGPARVLVDATLARYLPSPDELVA